MKKTFITIMACLMAIITLTLTACGDDKNEIISMPDVTMDSEFEITLDAHSGTAYQWSYEIDSSGIEYVSMKFVPQNDEDDWTGGGKLVYTFKGIKKGEYKIKFELSIESEPPIEVKTYKIKVVAE